MAARKAVNRLAGSYVLLYEPQLRELRWWLEQLRDPSQHCLPLASRISFPFADEAHLVISYSDAARELNSPAESGYGAWTVFGDTLYYIAGLWSPSELATLSINVLELAAENMATFTFLAQARSLGRGVTHTLDFVDNTAAEHSANRGKPSAPAMQDLVASRFDALDAANVFSSVERITSAANDWADGLSRGSERAQEVIRMAEAAGLSAVQLFPLPEWRDLSQLRQSAH